MSMNNKLVISSDLLVSKEAQKTKSDKFISLFLNGEVEPLALLAKLKSVGEVINNVLSDDRVKDIVSREIEKYGKEATYKGVRFQMKELGVKYDYSNCGDPKYNVLVQEKERVAQLMKEREEYLKKVPEGETFLDDTTGEVYKLIRPIKRSSYAYTVTFPKN